MGLVGYSRKMADIESIRITNSATVDTSTTIAPPAHPAPLRSVHTSSFAQILDRQEMSLAVSTYQAGKLVLLRPEASQSGPVLNTHFRILRSQWVLPGSEDDLPWARRARFGSSTTYRRWGANLIYPNLPHVAMQFSFLAAVNSPAMCKFTRWPGYRKTMSSRHRNRGVSQNFGSSIRGFRVWPRGAINIALFHVGSRHL